MAAAQAALTLVCSVALLPLDWRHVAVTSRKMEQGSRNILMFGDKWSLYIHATVKRFYIEVVGQ